MYELIYATNVGTKDEYESASNEYLDEKESTEQDRIDYYRYDSENWD